MKAIELVGVPDVRQPFPESFPQFIHIESQPLTREETFNLEYNHNLTYLRVAMMPTVIEVLEQTTAIAPNTPEFNLTVCLEAQVAHKLISDEIIRQAKERAGELAPTQSYAVDEQITRLSSTQAFAGGKEGLADRSVDALHALADHTLKSRLNSSLDDVIPTSDQLTLESQTVNTLAQALKSRVWNRDLADVQVNEVERLVVRAARLTQRGSQEKLDKTVWRLTSALHALHLGSKSEESQRWIEYKWTTYPGLKKFNHLPLSDQADLFVVACEKATAKEKAAKPYQFDLADSRSKSAGTAVSIQQLESAVAYKFEQQGYKDEWLAVSSRNRAFLTLMLLQNKLNMQAKVARLLDSPEAALALSAISGTQMSRQYAEWFTAAHIAIALAQTASNEAQRSGGSAPKINLDNRLGSADAQPPDDKGRNARLALLAIVSGLTISVIILAACGGASDTDQTPPGISTTVPNLSPEATAAFVTLPPATPEILSTPVPDHSPVLTTDMFHRVAPIDGVVWNTIQPAPDTSHFVTQRSLELLSGIASPQSDVEQTLLAQMQAAPSWVETQFHCAAGCELKSAVVNTGNPNEFAAAHFLQAKDGFIFAVAPMDNGGIDWENSRWLAPLYDKSGQALVPQVVFDFAVRSENGQLVPDTTNQVRRVVWSEPNSGAIVAFQTLLADGIADIVVVDHYRMFGDDNSLRDVLNRALTIRMDANGQLVAGYYTVDQAGLILWTQGPTDADGNVGRVAVFDKSSNTWRWQLLDATPLWTPTQEVKLPTNCFDQGAIQKVVDGFLLQTGFSSLAEYQKSIPEVKGTSWSLMRNDVPFTRVAFPSVIIGGLMVDIGNISGYQPGDTAYCALGVHSQIEQAVPMVLGIRKAGIWSQTVSFGDVGNQKNIILDAPGSDSQNAVDKWVVSHMGEILSAGFTLEYMDLEALKNDPYWAQGHAAVLPLLLSSYVSLHSTGIEDIDHGFGVYRWPRIDGATGNRLLGSFTDVNLLTKALSEKGEDVGLIPSVIFSLQKGDKIIYYNLPD